MLMRFYGAGLEQMVSIVQAGAGDTIVHRMAADPLVAGLLALHDLHPVPVEQRLGHAMDAARRKLGAHGSGVTLAGIDDEGTGPRPGRGRRLRDGHGEGRRGDRRSASWRPRSAGVVFDAAPAGPALLQIGVRPPERVP